MEIPAACVPIALMFAIMRSILFSPPHFQNHNFTRHESSGGGCCDCGDVESWKRECWCPKHRNAKDVPNPDLLMSESFDEHPCQLLIASEHVSLTSSM